MSRTLTRIRRATGDEILVRTGRTMTPTPRALELRAEVHELVRRAGSVLAPHDELDLATLERTFLVQGNDALVTALAPPLLALIAARAPGVRLRLLTEAPVDTPLLERGQVDLEIGAGPPDRTDVTVETAGHDRLVLAVRAGHPLLDGAVDVPRYAAADHVLVSRRGLLRDRVDDLLDAQDLRRRVVATLPTHSAALGLVATSDLVVTTAERACARWVAVLGLRIRPLPLPLDPAPMRLAWHRRYDNDPAHRWLRSTVAELLADLGQTS